MAAVHPVLVHSCHVHAERWAVRGQDAGFEELVDSDTSCTFHVGILDCTFLLVGCSLQDDDRVALNGVRILQVVVQAAVGCILQFDGCMALDVGYFPLLVGSFPWVADCFPLVAEHIPLVAEHIPLVAEHRDVKKVGCTVEDGTSCTGHKMSEVEVDHSVLHARRLDWLVGRPEPLSNRKQMYISRYKYVYMYMYTCTKCTCKF